MSVRVAFISDFDNSTTVITKGLDVQTLVQSLAPDYIVTGGDNRQRAITYTNLFNLFTYYKSMVAAERFWPCFGNHDETDFVGVQDWSTYFSYLPGNKRYYTKVIGDIEFFFLSSWVGEPDGTTHPSVQSAWLQAALAASTAVWKVVITHVPPYTNHAGNYAQSWMRNWPYETWGADLVLNGHTHAHERFRIGNLDFMGGGWSGNDETTLALNIAGTKFKVQGSGEYFGCILLTADADTLSVQAMDEPGGTVLDSLFLGTPPQDCGTVTVYDQTALSETDPWNNGASLPAGNYRISYVAGAIDKNPDGPVHVWTVMNQLGFQYNGGLATMTRPPDPVFWATQDEAEAYWNGWFADFTHTGGTISMLFTFGNTVYAAGDPNPTFKLELITEEPPPTPDPEEDEDDTETTCETIDCCEPSPFNTVSDQSAAVTPPEEPEQPSSDNQVPLMTANTTPSGECFAGPGTAGPNTYLVFNHDVEPNGQIVTNWLSGTWDAWPAYIGYKFTAGKTISSYKLFPLYYAGVVPKAVAAAPRDWFLEGSNDGVNYVPIDQQLNITDWEPDVGKTFTIAFPQPWQYYRLHVYAADETVPHAPAYPNGLAGLNEMELYL